MSPQARFGSILKEVNIARRRFLPDYGDGSDGSPASSSFTVAKQTYQWVDYTLDNGHTITLAAAYLPSIFRCRGTLTINGAINGDGLGNAGGTGPVAGSSADEAGARGNGPGGGAGGIDPYAGGGGASHATGSHAYDGLGSILAQAYGVWCAGSGGGGGAATDAANAGDGGAGGGGLILIARKVVLGSTCSLTLDGANGTNGTVGNSVGSGGGGGGSGGFALILADTIELPGAGTIITATAGSGGSGAGSGGAGGAGAVGRSYLVYLMSISPSDATSRSNPAATAISLRPTIDLG